MRKRACILVLGMLLFCSCLEPVTAVAAGSVVSEPSDWAKKEVGAADSAGITQGIEIGDYHENITRLSFSKLIWQMICVKEGIEEEPEAIEGNPEGTLENPEETEGGPEAGEEQPVENEEAEISHPFSDTDDPVVTKLYEAGIIKGTDRGTFLPDKLLTREEGACILYRTANYFGIDNPNSNVSVFYDGLSFSDWAVRDIKFISAQKTPDGIPVMGGYASMFSPKGSYTVEQAILSVYRLYRSLEVAPSRDSSWINKTGWRLSKVKLSAAGDCTLGRDLNAAYSTSLDAVYDKSGGNAAIFFKNVSQFFKDDVTLVNFEGTLTDATSPAEKTFRFKGRKAYTNILKMGSIDVVNIANNHSYDYLTKGYYDTVNTLSNAGIGVSGNEYVYVKDVNGVRIGFYGLKPMSSGLTQSYKNLISSRIQSLRDRGAQYIVGSFHWGIEREYSANSGQKALAHYAIDQGTDLVLGHHPHVLQNTEIYKGVQIVYSLGNFCFGGNKNPSDKDTAVFQATMTFDLETGKLISENRAFYPYRLSSVTYKNDYQPVPVSGSDAARVRRKLGI